MALNADFGSRGVNIDPSRKEEIERNADAFIAGCGAALIGRMIAEKATDTSDEEIERTLSPCVCGHWLMTLAKVMRDRGLLDLRLAV
ncbi:hypothetical protein L0Z42_29750 [Burkholderia multivorans]|uniref:hypothetical protein n=1 Tax=Burkholderia cepacia complex TaxID=87882 RepID=UPI00018E3AA7|nr:MULTISPECIES: hypothetical protein [Burkholderia cepacia complex]EED97327.1 hypothetical protein BURMUCGD1_6656 [Burkholderia multivorans CGD1]MCO1374559.1 hypothetical protein [Burkholderia multivorans]MCO1374669.1 hypothetical protein [Burkholderia multivorans]MCO1459810.1 hypothetical protein [Burkholderia multivorans]MCO1470746.1 hypothetical protein [Burkholderia multivorans]